MPLVPAFEIGPCNAWIFMSYIMLVLFFPSIYNRFSKNSIRKREIPIRLPRNVQYSKIEKVNAYFFWLFFLFINIYSIFLPLKIGTAWFYIGLPIILIGLVMVTVVMMQFAFGPLDKPVTTGIYRFSRHPMYICLSLTYLGISIASASIIFLAYWLLYPVSVIQRVGYEERQCLEHYGESYRQYMDKTPRWLGMPNNQIIESKVEEESLHS